MHFNLINSFFLLLMQHSSYFNFNLHENLIILNLLLYGYEDLKVLIFLNFLLHLFILINFHFRYLKIYFILNCFKTIK